MRRRVKCGRCLRVVMVPIGVKVHFHHCTQEKARPTPRLETEEVGRQRFGEILTEARKARKDAAGSAWGQTAAAVHRLIDEGLSLAEIAEQLGIHVETVRGHARKRQ